MLLFPVGNVGTLLSLITSSLIKSMRQSTTSKGMTQALYDASETSAAIAHLIVIVPLVSRSLPHMLECIHPCRFNQCCQCWVARLLHGPHFHVAHPLACAYQHMLGVSQVGAEHEAQTHIIPH